MLIVYKVVSSGRAWSFGLGTRCTTWAEANAVRAKIAAEEKTSKDNSMPIVYDENGNFVVEGWQKGR